MYCGDDYGINATASAGWGYGDDTTTTCNSDYFYIQARTYWVDVPFTSTKDEIAIAAAEKDRLYWSFPVVLFSMWEYAPAIRLFTLRLMFSLSGWLARVGKKRKSGK